MKWEKGRGFLANVPSFFLLTSRTAEGERWASAAALAAGPGHGGGRGQRGKREGAMGSRFPSPISEEGGRREGCDGHGHGGRAAAMGSASRGGQG